MAEITFYLIMIVIILHSCNKSADNYTYKSFMKDGYNIIFYGSLDIQYNLHHDTIILSDTTKSINDTLQLSKEEKDFIVGSLRNDDLLKPRGEERFIGKNLIMPPNNDKILIFKNEKLISTFYVNGNFESESFFPSKDEKNIIELRDKIKNILFTKKRYILMRERIYERLKKEGGYLL